MRNPVLRGGVRTWLLWIAAVSALFHGTMASIASGSVFFILGMVVQFWSKGCLHRNCKISQSGPYRLVRHPFYSANLLIDTGIAVMSGFWVLVVVFPFWWTLAYLPVMRREEAHLTARFGDAYRHYAERLPRVLPWRRPVPAGPGGFSWTNRNIIRQEIARALRFLSYPLMFLVILRFGNAGMEVLTAPQAADFALAGAIAGLHLLALAWRKYAVPRMETDQLPQAGRLQH